MRSSRLIDEVGDLVLTAREVRHEPECGVESVGHRPGWALVLRVGEVNSPPGVGRAEDDVVAVAVATGDNLDVEAEQVVALAELVSQLVEQESRDLVRPPASVARRVSLIPRTTVGTDAPPSSHPPPGQAANRR